MNTNLRKKALFPVVAMVLVSVIMLSSVTYAWFTMSNTASVNSLEVNVTAADGIQISLNARDWKSKIVAGDILTGAYTDAKNQYPTGDMAPVSSAGNVNTNGHMEMFDGTLNADDTLTVTQATDGESDNYIVFDLFFKMASDKKISLDIGDGASVVDDASLSTGAAKSARVAFVNLGAATTTTDAIGLKTKNEVYIWEPNADQHLDSVADSGVTGKVEYQGVASTDVNNRFADVTTQSPTSSAEILNLKEGINKVRVYIWMEGQDVDCINDASGGKFITNLKFSQPTEDANA